MNCLPVPPEGGPPGGGADGQTRGPDQRLGRNQRLTRSASFQEAFSQQQKWVGRFMVLWLRNGEGASLRLGLVSSRKVGNAVKRVRARRVLREVFRRNRDRLDGAVDLVIVARAAIVTASPSAVDEEFIGLARRAGLLKAQ